MPWSTIFVDAFAAARYAPLTFECASHREAKRRQAQFHAFRRQYREEYADHPQLCAQFDSVVIEVKNKTVRLITKQKLRELLAQEIEEKLRH